MKFEIALYPSEEGFAVCVPSLPGCWSQGASKEEAVENISFAIREYLEAESEPPSLGGTAVGTGPGSGPTLQEGAEVREVEITD